jgi:hypothetical protein
MTDKEPHLMGNRTPVLIQIPLPIEGATIEIPLTKGRTAIVDATDVELTKYRWHAISCDGQLYAARRETIAPKKTRIRLMHQFVLENKIGRRLESDELCDHVDGNRLNNRRSNLRLATYQQNAQNQRLSSLNQSGYKGVSLIKENNTWYACIRAEGKSRSLGRYDHLEDAAIAYNHAATKYFGEFAVLNDIPNWETTHPIKRTKPVRNK